MSETATENGGAGAHQPTSTGTARAPKEVSKSEHMNVCPCGGDLRFGSRDPCEGDYYWCCICYAGPILFPLGTGPRNLKPAIVDADALQALQSIRGAATAIQNTLLVDIELFDPAQFARDLVAS